MSETLVSFDRGFFSSAAKLAPAESRRVLKTVDLLSTDPRHPSLHLERLHADRSGRLHSVRVNDDVRILLAREGNTYVLFEAGRHDDLYARAARGRFVHNPGTGFVGFIEPDGADSIAPEPRVAPASKAATAAEAPGVYDHWSDRDLTAAGFSIRDVAALRSCRCEDDLFDAGLSDAETERAIDLLQLTPEQWRVPTLTDDAAPAEAALRQAIHEHGAVWGLSPLFSADEVAKLAAAPIEDWMIFLHPDQRAVVERRYEGPARARGAAGTGKTVVALHRAAELARRYPDDGPRRILFTTYVASLPPVFEQLYRRLPTAPQKAVEFINIDKLARRVCQDAGIAVVTDPRAVDAAYASAWRKVITPGTPLARLHLSRKYLRDEIQAVIKGRGTATQSDYLATERTGRRVPLTADARRQVWALMIEWQKQMSSRGTLDFPDVVLLAAQAAGVATAARYRAAVIDEAQDLTLVGFRLVRALVNGGANAPDRPDGLFLVGDGAQRIYAGGFTLRQAGVEVRGRTTLLRTNYRNTAEVLAAAQAVAGEEPVEDLDESYRRSEETADVARDGERPVLVGCADGDALLAELVRRIRRGTVDDDVSLGDVGVFAPTNEAVRFVTTALSDAGVPWQGLDRYDGVPAPKVKVGTFHRAKGLEFKIVFLPGLSAGRFPWAQAPGQDDVEYAEARSLAMSTLFVAMTRARDSLVVLHTGEPSEVLANAGDRFDTQVASPA